MALSGNDARDLSRSLIDTYFRTTRYPFTRHHIDSYDQFLQQDLIHIIRSQNPIMILKNLNEKTGKYKYHVEIYVGGEDGTAIEIGAPTICLHNTDDIRLLYPNEARLRNLTYSSTLYADIVVKITYTSETGEVKLLSPPAETFTKWALCNIPIMLHSRYCVLNNKPKEFLREAGECPYDNGGYFIVDGAEKVLVTRQEQAFNTLYITPQNDPKINVYASIECLSATTRQVKRVAFALMRYVERNDFKSSGTSHATIQVSIPFVRKPVPLFVLFRALGFQSDEDILHLIFPDFERADAKLLLPKLHSCIIDAYPFLNTTTSIQYIKSLTKGFSEAHVLDIIRNQLFIHMPNDPHSQALFLGDCVRKILRVSEGYDSKTDRDDTRNQRCLTSGFLLQELFSNSYKVWTKAFMLTIDKEYNYNPTYYKDENFARIFQASQAPKIFMAGMLNDMIMKGFKGKWGTGLGEEKSGVLQAMSRLSYTDFMSHCRRVILDFDTNMKLTGPRKLHTSQYGYFCTSETPTGASIGITKNLSIMTAISTSSQLPAFEHWLLTTGGVNKPEDITLQERIEFVPVYINGGMFGYIAKPDPLTTVLKCMKRSGCIPYSASISFSVRDRMLYLYLDAGRPLRPLIWLEKAGQLRHEKIRTFKSWRELVIGTLRPQTAMEFTEFYDPYPGKPLEEYVAFLADKQGVIEYIDPYEQNESFIANNPITITPETTHMEVHPSTIMSMMTSMIPFAPHNQSPRNQLSCSQSKQGLSIYATNWRNRFDNTAHVLCYGEMPLTRTMYNNYLGEGKMAYGMNCILAIACWTGYNQEDGIVMNYDAVQRGMFRSMAFRSYQAFEENDEKMGTKVRFGNPKLIAAWKDLTPGLDYSKLDDRGIIREGEYVDETTVIVGAYLMSNLGGQINDASTTPQVWTRGRVEKVVIMVNNLGLRLVKIRVVQDRIPELGDKFCLTEDHEVRTAEGWKPIHTITKSDVVLQRHANGTTEYVHPIETYEFDHTGVMYLVKTTNGSLYVTSEHRLFVCDSNHIWHLMMANLLCAMQDSTYYMMDANGASVKILSITMTSTNEIGDKVYCLSVPSEVFLVRRKGEEAFWTGNSNRHGQKGTIGALLRGHDMPRTLTGLVPDMIMNPHAIPSRMTIAQNLEQLMGKTAALSGCIGDGTSFMNDGSPQEAIGGILEQIGFEKYGNEVMYNGATGEQIPATIFIGPVYGMRLKHMVEDKWQARGQGRKEARTHQPTAGRGAQGGLKIGEMDRDAIIAHAGMAFVKESFMERSDGTTMPLCISCGTIPIYNPRLNIAICPMCDGPVKYTGDTVNTMEILPTLGRPKSRIVQVEMPYSTKLLTQEQETFLNLTMRYITTKGVERLRPLEFSGKATEEVHKLEKLVLQEPVVPEQQEALTLEQLASLGISLGAEMTQPIEMESDLGTIVEEEIQPESVMAFPVAASASNPVVYPEASTMPIAMPTAMPTAMPATSQMGGMQDIQFMPMQQQMQQQMPQQMQQMQPMQMQQPMQQMQQMPQQMQQQMPQTGGYMPLQSEAIHTPPTPHMGPLIAVDTNPFTMAQQFGGTEGGRRVRRYQGGGGQALQGAPMDSMNSTPAPMMSAAMSIVRVNKME